MNCPICSKPMRDTPVTGKYTYKGRNLVYNTRAHICPDGHEVQDETQLEMALFECEKLRKIIDRKK